MTTNDEAAKLAERADAARVAIREGADPRLTLSYVLWPPPDVEQAQLVAAILRGEEPVYER